MTQPPVSPPPPPAIPPVPPEPAYLPPPPPPPSEQVRSAYLRRHETDYIFDFWTAFGWTVLTCGFYLIYIVYKLAERSRNHNLRRLELLEGANRVAWERAGALGLTEELTPNFERVATHLEGLRRLTREFRDPIVWAVLAFVARGIVELVLFILLDGDLVKHDYDEGGAENELAFIFTRLGTPVQAPDAGRLHQAENYVGRVLAAIFTCGVYTFFWLYNIMDDGNRHFTENWAWEDSLAQAVQGGQA